MVTTQPYYQIQNVTTVVYSLADYYMFWAFIDGLLFAIIICGNILTILAVRLSRRLRNVTSNYFVLSLAISDFLVGLTLPYHLAFYVTELLGTIPATCIMRFVLISLACCASIYNLIAIAVDRYIAIVHPLKYSTYMTRRAALVLIFLGWINAIAIATVPIYWNCFDAATECEMDTVLPRYYTVAILTPMLCFIWLSMFILYWQIWKEASTHARRLRHNGMYNNGTSDWKSVQVVLLVLGCFSICWLPYLIVACSRAFDWHKKASPVVYKSMFSLAMANSGMNPMIYAWKNKNFRKAFQKLLHFQSPNRSNFNSSLKNYLQKQKELNSLENNKMEGDIRPNQNGGLSTICNNYMFESEEALEVTPM
ncbi:D(2)-like dopamine receptor [Cephus cinctus]|uniref:D(2)-like dopamine receptor n=1 Tax=Cephus cinctus TaxID=211228 RepID=A0AAJ7FJS5_CEPCN|nr:D(2)-like dopamine receptor [Cephus cinctus]XP_015595316.1 D(2)-like dopamine receptor [Cephus cinctus]XP_015595317.1 D(2)-like dopamine receptor [Cephus cinctus]